MTDVPDFTTVQAGMARVVINQAFTPGVTPAVRINLQQTDRSLVFVVASAVNLYHPQVLGVQSGVQYGGQLAQLVNTRSQWGVAVPAYGAVDQQVDVSLTGPAVATELIVVAVPDEAVAGQYWAPEFVSLIAGNNEVGYPAQPIAAELYDGNANPLGTAAHPLIVTDTGAADAAVKLDVGGTFGVAGAPIAVELQDGAGNQQGTAAHPIRTTEVLPNGSVAVSLALPAAATVLVGGPGAGLTRKVTNISWVNVTAGDVVSVGVNENTASTLVFNAPNPGSPIPVEWYIEPGGVGIYVRNQSGARGTIYATYHDF